MNAPGLSRAQLWARAVRVRSFTASVIPIAIGIALAWFAGPIEWWLAAITMVAAVACHAGANLANDYFDHRSGVDSGASFGPKRLIASGALSARTTIVAAAVAFLVATILGLVIVWQTGWGILALALASIAAAILYTGGPKPLGDMALGEVTEFVTATAEKRAPAVSIDDGVACLEIVAAVRMSIAEGRRVSIAEIQAS